MKISDIDASRKSAVTRNDNGIWLGLNDSSDLLSVVCVGSSIDEKDWSFICFILYQII